MQKLNKRVTYEEVSFYADVLKKGSIVINMDGKPILYKHPYDNICLLLGYDKNNNISFAQTIKDGEKTYHDPKQVIANWNSFKTKTTDLLIEPNPLTQVFVQEFLFTQDYSYLSVGQESKSFDSSYLHIRVRESNKNIIYGTYSSIQDASKSIPFYKTFEEIWHDNLSFFKVDPYSNY
jgi:hypothetical protein